MSSELLYKGNRPQVFMVYRLINHAGCWMNTRRICKSRAADTTATFIFALCLVRSHDSRGKETCQRDGQDVRLKKWRRTSVLSYSTRTLMLYMNSELSKWFLAQTKRSSSNHEFRCVAYYDIKACKTPLS